MRFSRAVHWHTTIWHMLHKPIFSDVSATTQTHGLPMNARALTKQEPEQRFLKKRLMELG